MAEYLLRHHLERTSNWLGTVYSAGVSALYMHPADPGTITVMLNYGIDLTSHRATQLTQQHIRQADIVLAMEKCHIRAVLEMDPTARGKSFLLGHWSNSEISDPYGRGTDAHIATLRALNNNLSMWIEKMGLTATSLPQTRTKSKSLLPL
jgi:protein-tyrosine phosphatase